MSDFDEVLERLLVDPAFAERLAGDPDGALAGYRLSSEEAALLRTRGPAVPGGVDSGVERRTSKSSLFGLLSSLTAGGEASSGGAPGGGSGGGPVAAPEQGLAPAPEQGLAPAPEQGLAPAPEQGLVAGTGAQGYSAPGDGYHTHIDADGDGHWDGYVYRDRADGGADVFVDADHDGRADFVGHDFDRDGLIDEAVTDSDRDGRPDARWFDDDHDGWLDRSVPEPTRSPGSSGTGDAGQRD